MPEAPVNGKLYGRKDTDWEEVVLPLPTGNNLSITRDLADRVIQVVDTDNSQTWNINWTDFDTTPAKLYIQRVGDPKIYTINYSVDGYPDTVIYA